MTMRPWPCLRMAGMIRRVRSCQPKKFASNWARSTSVETSSSAPGWA